jgi:serine/threonine protein kinase
MPDTLRFSETVIDEYPYPIARQARKFNNAHSPEEQFETLSHVVEMSVRYLGAIALASYIRGGVQDFRVDYLANRLRYPDWDVWLELLSNILRHYNARDESFVLQRLIPLYFAHQDEGTAVYQACHILMAQPRQWIGSYVNQDSTFETFLGLFGVTHREGIENPDLMNQLLLTCFAAAVVWLNDLSFLAKQPLINVSGSRVTSSGIEFTVEKFMGASDHPVVLEEEWNSLGLNLEPQQVYVCDPNGLPTLGLHPFMIAEDQVLYILFQNNQNEEVVYLHCGTFEFYHPDAADLSIAGIGPRVAGISRLQTITDQKSLLQVRDDADLPPPVLHEVSGDIAKSVDFQATSSPGSRLPEKNGDSIELGGAVGQVAARKLSRKNQDQEKALPSGSLDEVSALRWVHFPGGYIADIGLSLEEIPVGKIVGPYKILEKLGDGPVAATYQAKPLRSQIEDHQLILRILKQTIMEEVLSNSIPRELRAWWLVSQQRSPNIMGLNSISRTHDKRLVLEIERFGGLPLNKLLRKSSGKGLPLKKALDIAIQVCRALLVAHKHKLYHAAIKPSNVFVLGEEAAQVKLSDFSLSENILPYLMERKAISPENAVYLTPEILSGYYDLSESTDVYAVGIMLYNMLTGRLPYYEETYPALLKCIQHDYIPLRTIDPSLPIRLETIIQRAMHPKPHKRFQQIETLLHELEVVKRSIDTVYTLSDLLLRHVPAKDLNDFLSDRGVRMLEQNTRVVEWCLTEAELGKVIYEFLGYSYRRKICQELGMEDNVASSSENFVRGIFLKIGVKLPSQPSGLAQRLNEVHKLRDKLFKSNDRSEISEVVNATARECEAVLKDLIYFHSILLFQDAYWNCLLVEVLGEKKRKLLKRRSLDTSLGDLFNIIYAFNTFLSGNSPEANWFHQTFNTDELISLPKAWDQIPAIRNDYSHHSTLMEQKETAEVRSQASKFVQTCLEMLKKLEESRLYPMIAVVRDISVDYYGRRSVHCLGDDSRTYTIYTNLELVPGQKFFLPYQSEPICIDPILVPFPETYSGAV